MRSEFSWGRAGLLLSMSLAFAVPAAADGTFDVFSYNVEGLPPLVGVDRTSEIGQIGPKIEARHQALGDQIMGLQEVFQAPYYTSLTGATTHTNETAMTTTGSFMTGDGLVHMSDYASGVTVHNPWSVCGMNAGDCLTPKGYSFTRYTLEMGAELDVYNVHMDAGQLAEDIAARTTQFAELTSAIGFLSTGRAVIVMGDTNSRFTRSTDVVDTFVSTNGLTDAWVQFAQGGVVPGDGAVNDSGCPPPRGNAMGGAVDASGATCELVDKIMYRSGSTVMLSALS